MASRTVAALALVALPALAANPDCAPGGNFDLSPWSLQLPTGGGKGGGVDTISSKDLQGCEGYSGDTFFTDKQSGQIVLTAPGNPEETGCSTTSGSEHCRTELREVDPSTGKQASWGPGGSNVLNVTMTVVTADDGSHGTAIGQVFAAEASKPLLEMYFGQDGEIVAGVKPNPTGGQKITSLGNVDVGAQFSYQLSYSNNLLTATINGQETQLDTGDWDSPNCYFKAGNYNQGKSGGASEVHIAALEVSHS